MQHSGQYRREFLPPEEQYEMRNEVEKMSKRKNPLMIRKHRGRRNTRCQQFSIYDSSSSNPSGPAKDNSPRSKAASAASVRRAIEVEAHSIAHRTQAYTVEILMTVGSVHKNKRFSRNFVPNHGARENGRCTRPIVKSIWRIKDVYFSQNHPATSGGNPRSNSVSLIYPYIELGIACWDPARGQFAFSPFNNDLVLSAADQTAIVAILNGLSR